METTLERLPPHPPARLPQRARGEHHRRRRLQLSELSRATIYDSSAHDYRVLVPSDAGPGITAMHLDELGAIGVLHANTATITAALDQLPDR